MLFNCRARQPPPEPPLPQCLYTGCTRRAVKCAQKTKHSKALLSLYCKDHACRQRLDGMMCPTPKATGTVKYCEDHRRCQSEGCSNTRICANTSQDWPYCPKLLILQTDTCALQGCHQKRSPISQMCGLHTPMCLIPGCDQPRTENGLYCPSHSCADDNCNSVISGGSWCKDHRVCKTEGCKHTRAVTADGGLEQVCWQHLPSACTAPGCVSVVIGGVKFCDQHKCIYPPCHEAKDNSQDISRLYCVKHTCHDATCPQLICDPSNPSLNRYCIIHTCTAPSCSHPSKPASRHCALHTCLYPSCSAPRTADPLAVPEAQFCAAHECRSPGCHGAAGTDGVFCDATHACSLTGYLVPLDGSEGKCKPLCATHPATVTGYIPYPSDRRRSFPARPASVAATVGIGPKQQQIYVGPVEEALELRLREEQERQINEARLDGSVRAWEAARAGGVSTDVRGRRGRGDRLSCDSGYVGSASVSEDSNITFVS
ncbi:uncharacterized protein CTRU02_203255 [Colletotrichum truncatum]|uniref:Uncharacterized protein n=1 Tax=Colletotrichum truncatum TaxID=5467 RepID=A0ACC3Z8W0_COLTU|nr:uncharacterized protein CTRU02_09096 [Colletotrichum truncatum]KAF6789304.1 hypothetical protein CTRU02_09096 [Colletotrichum truncatum]